MRKIRLVQLTKINLNILFSKPRWIAAFFSIIFLSSLQISRISSFTYNKGVRANIWDSLFLIFADGYSVLYFLTPLCFYLISDIAINSGLGNEMLLRSSSRKEWWLSKALSLFISIFAYIFGTTATSIILSSFVLPLEGKWSLAAQKHPIEFSINPDLLNSAPFLPFIKSLLLLAVGWFGLCLMGMFFSSLFKKHLYGFTANMVFLFLSIISFVSGTRPPLSYFFFHEHLFYVCHNLGNHMISYPKIGLSILYWLVFITCFVFFGLKQSDQIDFM